MSTVHEILAAAVFLIQIQGNQPVGTATGFFYLKDDAVYLITNRHVLRDEQKGHRPDTLRLRMHADPNDLAKNVDFDLPLYSKGVSLWFTHPIYPNPPIDIAVVTLDQARIKLGHFFRGLSKQNFLPDNLVIGPGEDVMAIGFPRGLSDSTHNLPILRNAMIASAYGVPFQGQPMFLIDANLHPGMSGSAVLTKPKNTWQTKEGATAILTGTPIYLLGVHSATLSSNLPTGVEPLGLGTVWYANLIEEIIATIPHT